MRTIRRSLAACGLILAAMQPLTAHEGATGVVLKRMGMMSDVAREMKSLARLTKDREASLSDIAAAARRIGALAEDLSAMFSVGSDKGSRTEARPAIWENWSEFEAMTKSVAGHAAEMANAADAQDRPTVQSAFEALTGTCSACHERFRAKSHHH